MKGFFSHVAISFHAFKLMHELRGTQSIARVVLQ